MCQDPRVYNSLPEISQGLAIATAYEQGLVQGWVGTSDEFKIVGDTFFTLPDKMVERAAGRKMFLYRVNRKVLSQDTKNYPQEIGDCVSFGAKNAIEYLMCAEILIKGDREQFTPIFPPYLYGTGRVFIGGGQLGNQDGSSGAWMAQAVIKYGTIPSNTPNCPPYSGSVAKKWGAKPGPSAGFVAVGKTHPVKSAAKVNSWEELVAAIVNGYPVTISSNQGFTMEAAGNGFHQPRGNWAHQMCFIGVDDEYAQPYALILNSWGDAHGHLKSFDGEDDLPVGVLRVTKSAAEGMIRSGEAFAYGNFDGFPEQGDALDEKMFKIVG
jgi:hypothetical protein